MKNSNPNKILALCVGILFLITLNTNLPAIIYYNGVDTSFDLEDLDEYIIKGAGFFLKSYSDYLLLLNKAELAELKDKELNYKQLQKDIDSAIVNMEAAIAIYKDLNTKVDGAFFNPSVIDELKKFDYDGLLNKRKDFIASIFNEVKSYLSEGKIFEICITMLNHSEEILKNLKHIQKKIQSRKKLETPELWDLNEQYSKYLLFGQYAARIFGQITKKVIEKSKK